ncbi:TlpA family protein disulfide reductase [Lutibacter sp. HS1-25]|uniref:TlpA disulfide reductase family protein n=1 Tax=Lutibacter sp. HS1-25 TaxID=2485000 RepID=UPI00101266D0|nr:TlpA disulfide reductase family protein [Lutibacter sp. HS1-25]RXP64481.1 TlpA family protein disulfide reductase [Lutibacter sp. HS1-25]
MKKLIYVLSVALAIAACSENAPKDYVTFSGKITNQNSDSLIVRSRTFSKKIMVNPDGTFSDTLKVETGNYNVYDGTEGTTIYLKNGFEIHMTIDTKEFDESVAYTGIGAEASNYLAKKALMQEAELSNESMFNLDSAAYKLKTATIIAKFDDLLKNTQNLDSTFIAQQNQQLESFSQYLTQAYSEKMYLNTVLGKGVASPKFVNYENYKGGTTSLDDLKGKYVYIDVWATWCGPCKAEIPFLKEVEEAYQGKNIQFLSISVDRAKDHDTWKQMIEEKELGGIQLFADNDWNSDFVQAYKINGIPRFILIDPAGNIVSSDAPRPSSDELKVLLEELSL